MVNSAEFFKIVLITLNLNWRFQPGLCNFYVDTTQFLFRRFLELRWAPKLIMNGSKILSMVVENLHFVHSLNYLPMSLKAFDLARKKG